MFAQTSPQTYTASSTFTVPAGVTEITVEAWGGGGRGGSAVNSPSSAGGGGGGAYSKKLISVSSGTTYSVIVGAGGNSSGTISGGDSYFNTSATILAKGGSGVANNTSTGGSGGVWVSTNGDSGYSGGNGASSSSGPTGYSGGGGSSAGTASAGNNASTYIAGTAPTGGGAGGNGYSGSDGSGTNATGVGGGGGGSRKGPGSTLAGGNGADGKVIISWTISCSVSAFTGGTATQSSTSFSAEPSRARDGNTSGVWSNGSVTHTNNENNPWWLLDMGVDKAIDNVVIYNRTDCCGTRLDNFILEVLDVSDNVVYTHNNGVATTTNTVSGINTLGRKIRIRLEGSGKVLSLAEVVVNVNSCTPPTITSLGATSGCEGSSITINGANFTGATAANVTIGGTPVTSIISNDGSTIIAVIGAGTTGNVSVTTSTGTATSAATFTVNAAPTITSTTPGSRTGTGTVNLSATASSGTISWYSSLTGGTALGTGNSFTTPSISSTTTYYVETNNGSCTSTPREPVVATVNSYCEPSSSNSSYYINNFYTTGGVTNITNNNSGYSTNGYGDFTSQSVSQYAGSSINFNANFTGGTFGFGVWVDWNNDGDFSDTGEEMYLSGSYNSSVSNSFTIPSGITIGNYRMRILADYYDRTPDPCVTGSLVEGEDYTLNIISVVVGPGIEVTGNANNISDGDSTPDTTDGTDFGTTDTATPSVSTFTIYNNGTTNLVVSGISSDNSVFSIGTLTYPLTITSGNSQDFTVTFLPTTSGTQTATITVNSNASSPLDIYTFAVEGAGTTGPPQYTIYYENFDENNGSWSASTGSSTNWAYGTGLTSAGELGEGNYWYTNNYNNYSSNAYTTVESPILSTTGYENLLFSADIRYNVDSDPDDGMIVEYRKRTSGTWSSWTILGANGDGDNWYDGSDVDAISTGSDGWTGDSSTTQTIKNYFQTAQISLSSTLNDSDEIQVRFVFASDGDTIQDEGVAIDNVFIYGDPIVPFSDPIIGPGSMNTDLKLWLKATAEIGATSNGSDIINWDDEAFDNDAISLTANSPSFRDNSTDNINFNPVVNFDSTSQQYMRGKGGYFSHDYFVVIKSNGTIDNTGTNRQVPIAGRVADVSPQVDGTGLGLGSISKRFTDEVVAHMASSFPKETPNDDSYGRAFSSTTQSYTDEVIIYNIKTNSTHTQTEIYKNGIQIDNTTGTTEDTFIDLNFSEFNNQQFYLGVGRFSLNGNVDAYVDGKISEVISYSDTNSTLGQQKIQSYLGIKNGITLHAYNSSTVDRLNDVDYIDSAGTVIWDTSSNSGYNYDIAGIGKDDASLLNQKQSKSQNDESDTTGPTSGVLTMGLSDIYDTNQENIDDSASSTFNDREFLCWGNNNASLDGTALSIEVDMSAGIGDVSLTTPVSFEAIPRIWKVVEVGGDIPKVKVSIVTSAVRTAVPPDGRYLMFISDTGIFDPTADYRVMTEVGSNLETEYDFDGTKYITFGWAPERKYERSIYFNPVNEHYIDMEDALDLNSSEFTVSAWIMRGSNSNNTSILSKRDVSYTEGYDFKINNNEKFEMSWGNSGAQKVISSITIPKSVWHHLAVIYKNGTATIYIDGVEDTSNTLSNPASTDQSFFIAAAGKTNPEAFFDGNIDEVRVWDVALDIDELHYIMNQEIESNSNFVGGKVIPNATESNEVVDIPWSNLIGYYPMSVYTYTNTKDESGNGHQGALRNLDTVDWQTAPLPYVSDSDGAWDTSATWLNNAVQYIPNSSSIVDGSSIDWNIVRTSHNITSGDRDISVLGLINEGGTLTIADSGTLDEKNDGQMLRVTHYLELDGAIDLVGESQLLQDAGSVLDNDSGGYIERDQQGTANSYNYNYWSASVAPISGDTSTRGTGVSSLNSSTSLSEVFKDGTTSASPLDVTFEAAYTAADSGPTSPITISTYWLYKFNGTNSDYDSWASIDETSSLLPGEGYTMKGTSGSVTITTEQNYVFKGKPYNGDFTLPIAAGDDRLIGNPYASAMDSYEFIMDNISTSDGGRNTTGNIFNGAIYFWDHFGPQNSHYLSDYVGGYATRNLLTSAPAISNDARINATGETSTETPGRYIPVNQGFFVITSLNTSLTSLVTVSGGNIEFKNSQRAYKTESTSASVFLKEETSKKTTTTTDEVENDEDTRQIIRLMFDSPTGYHRQIVAGIERTASNNFDFGYDAPIADAASEDMYWLINDANFVIQGVNNFDVDQELPLVIKISEDGKVTISIDELENIDTSKEIYIKDDFTGLVHQINDQSFEIELAAGEYTNRFSLAFKSNETLAIEEEILNEGMLVYMNNITSDLHITNNTESEIKSVSLYNYLGQNISSWNSNLSSNMTLSVKASTGVYFVQITTNTGSLNKKIIIK